MNEIIKKIEAEQLKAEVPEFHRSEEHTSELQSHA